MSSSFPWISIKSLNPSKMSARTYQKAWKISKTLFKIDWNSEKKFTCKNRSQNKKRKKNISQCRRSSVLPSTGLVLLSKRISFIIQIIHHSEWSEDDSHPDQDTGSSICFDRVGDGSEEQTHQIQNSELEELDWSGSLSQKQNRISQLHLQMYLIS